MLVNLASSVDKTTGTICSNALCGKFLLIFSPLIPVLSTVATAAAAAAAAAAAGSSDHYAGVTIRFQLPTRIPAHGGELAHGVSAVQCKSRRQSDRKWPIFSVGMCVCVCVSACRQIWSLEQPDVFSPKRMCRYDFNG